MFQALPDYVVTMRKPGKNAVPIKHTVEGADRVPQSMAEARRGLKHRNETPKRNSDELFTVCFTSFGLCCCTG